MGEVLNAAEAVWSGRADTTTHHPLGRPFGIEQVAEKTWFYKGFSGTVLRETEEGLIMVDPGAYFDAQVRFEAIRSVVEPRLNTAVFTHGHVDHVFGMPYYIQESVARGWPRPKAVGQAAMPARFRRYRESASWNGIINGRQFAGGSGRAVWPLDYHEPDIIYEDRLTVRVGGVRVLLRHARGETDDHTWVFFPDTRVLCTGDLFIYAVPNAGNPQKVQRYARDWAAALREMADLEPEILLPGHGWPILGADRVRQALQDTAALLESLHDQTLALMNQGASLDQVLHEVKAPADLIEKPYLRPVYDEPEFIVRNIWRLYGGWYDGTPSHLKPAPEQAQAGEIARLAGGADKLTARALELSGRGDHRLACHLADWAKLAEPDSDRVFEAVQRVYTARAGAETSTMAIGIFMTAARDAASAVPDQQIKGVSPIVKMQAGREKTDAAR
ncbi:MAG: MBL fold metallo-hydrolase [Proteobacteria bacterium]|nr:MBL fold metallo-hydrolase [Pseudomonadota bacterium]